MVCQVVPKWHFTAGYFGGSIQVSGGREMKTMALWAAVIAVASLAAQASEAARPVDPAAEVAALGREVDQAVSRHDAATLQRLFTEDWLLYTSSGRKVTKPEVLKQVADPGLVFEVNESS